jgi:hypothetical protein
MVKYEEVFSVDGLPDTVYTMCLEKAKASLKEQYEATDAINLYFPDHSDSTIFLDLDGPAYRIKSGRCRQFDAELEAYCKDVIKRPYIIINRVVYLVQGIDSFFQTSQVE